MNIKVFHAKSKLNQFKNMQLNKVQQNKQRKILNTLLLFTCLQQQSHIQLQQFIKSSIQLLQITPYNIAASTTTHNDSYSSPTDLSSREWVVE